MMECKKTQEFIPDAVDGRLTEVDQRSFNEHISKCADCRNEYELDAVTKEFIRNRFPRVKTPEEVANEIRYAITRQERSSEPPLKTLFTQVWRSPLARAAVVAGLIIIAALVGFLFTDTGSQSTVIAGDIISQSAENYDLILAGAIEPQLVEQNVYDLSGFFNGRVDFPVVLKSVRGCDWVGAVLSDHAGSTLAHLLYKIPAGMIYVYQANWKEVKRGERLRLPQHAVAALNETGWYQAESREDFSIVLWLYKNDTGETVCAAVAPMEAQQLMSLFGY